MVEVEGEWKGGGRVEGDFHFSCLAVVKLTRLDPALKDQNHKRPSPPLSTLLPLTPLKQPTMSAEEVAKAFIQHFYQTIDSNVDALAGLYVSFC